MAPNLRQRRRELLREEILEATHMLMAERGYAATSMDELAARVGVSKPTLYNQFPTKEDLVAAMAAKLFERVFADLAAAPGQSPFERLLALLHTVVRIQLERRTTAMQLWLPEIVEILERKEITHEQLINLDRLVVTLLREAIAAGEVDPSVDVGSAVRIFYGMVCAPSLGRLSCVEPPDPATMADAVVDVFRRGLSTVRR
jgi:AcrR family transcriptional regulator